MGGPDASLGERLAQAWGPFLDVYFRPVTLTLLALETGMGSAAPVVGHLLNLSLHLLVCLSLIAWLRAEQVSPRSAALVAAVYATLPVLSESVLWVSARGDLLVVLCACIALRQVALRFPLRLGGGGPLPDDAGGGIAMMVLAILCALGSKESGLAVAAAVILRAQWPTFLGQGRPGGRLLWSMVPAGLIIAFVKFRSWILPELGAPELAAPEGVERLTLTLGTLATMAGHALWPFAPDLAIGIRAVPASGDPTPLLGFVLIVVLVGLTTAGRLGIAPRLGFGAALLGCLLLPASNLLPLDIVARTADRYLNLPWLALAFALGLGLDRALGEGESSRKRLLTGAVVGIALLGAMGTWARSSVWATEDEFLHALRREADSGNGQPALVLGAWLASQERCQEAEVVLAEAAALLKLQGRRISEAQARAARSGCLSVVNRPQGAVTEARAAAVLDPSAPGAQARILRALRLGRRFRAAIEEGELTLRLYPADPEVAAELSQAYASALRFEESASALREARRRAGVDGPSPLLERLSEAQQATEAARARTARGDSGGYGVLAALAQEWGNPELAAQYRADAESQLLEE